MKRFIAHTDFTPLQYIEGAGMKEIKDSKGKTKVFKTRKAVEKYCLENKCMYVECKHIFYR